MHSYRQELSQTRRKAVPLMTQDVMGQIDLLVERDRKRKSEEDIFQILTVMRCECPPSYLRRHQEHNHVSSLLRVVDLQHQAES